MDEKDYRLFSEELPTPPRARTSRIDPSLMQFMGEARAAAPPKR